MPSSPLESRPPEGLVERLIRQGVIPELDDALVDLAPGVTVRRIFQRSVLLNPQGTERVTFVIRTEGGVARIVEAHHRWSQGCAIDELTDERLRRLAEVAIADEAGQVAAKRMMGDANVAVSDRIREFFPELPEELPAGVAVINSAELARVEQRALRTVRPKPGPKPVEADLKLEALKWYREGGIPLAMERTGRAERTLRRWIADARKLEQKEV
jgi:hypothetical protein